MAYVNTDTKQFQLSYVFNHVLLVERYDGRIVTYFCELCHKQGIAGLDGHDMLSILECFHSLGRCMAN